MRRGGPGGAGPYAQVVENLNDDREIFNGGEAGQGAAALRTGGDVDGENTVESLCSIHASPR